MRPLLRAALLSLLLGSPACQSNAPSGQVQRGLGQPIAVTGSPERGLAIVTKYQCARCHEGLPGGTFTKDIERCTGCHQAILSSNFNVGAATLREWQGHIKHLVHVPSLSMSQVRLRASFIERFLLSPGDLRPHLEDEMIRVPLTREQAADVASLLGGPDDPADAFSGDVGRGARLFLAKGCNGCHSTAAAAPESTKAQTRPVGEATTASAEPAERQLAPDLGYVARRMNPRGLRAWLRDPKSIKPDTRMPNLRLSDSEIDDLGSYLQTLTPAKPKTLPPWNQTHLERPISFAEVERRVFRKTCWHCHSDPDFAHDDGGPGNTGGFGFAGKGIVLSQFEGILGGYQTSDGTRHSLLNTENGKPPKLLASLLARRREHAGDYSDSAIGMPLGLPPLSDDDISLVAEWLEQGAPMVSSPPAPTMPSQSAPIGTPAGF